MEGNEKNEGFDRNNRDEIFSVSVRAGKRTYFFDVKSTKKDDYYLTITESKKRFDKDGNFTFEKHKIFLYKEDFDKFSNGLEEALSFIKDYNKEKMLGDDESGYDSSESEELNPAEFMNVEFEDLAN
ncbi:MAG: PUR family DNA/RNA-binding protein [Marinifilaceae bacterium]|jgi:hypothetical protein|nr:PUR family DNA/RNA-binding protein [Marinifilaceae bacterium]